jgi:hypothetical protein
MAKVNRSEYMEKSVFFCQYLCNIGDDIQKNSDKQVGIIQKVKRERNKRRGYMVKYAI